MRRIRVNTDTGYDGAILFFFLLGLAMRSTGRVPEARRLEASLRLLLTVAGIILAVVLRRWTARRFRDCYGYQLGVATVMSLIGAPVVGLPAMMLGLLGVMLVPFAGGWAALAFPSCGALAAGWWSGWRFGSWGCVWGALGALILLAIPAARTIFEDGFHWDLARFAGPPLLVAAFAGHFGARRARRAMEAWAARHGPAALAE